MDTIVKSISTEAPAQPLPVEPGDDTVGNYGEPNNIPHESGDGVIYELLESGNNPNSLPEDVQANIKDIEGYVYDALSKRGVPPTEANLKSEITKLKYEMGLDPQATPEAVIDRIGGVVKAWKNLSFIKDSSEKKQIFFKLANAPTGKAMNEIVFKAMENHQVWI